MTLYRSPDVLIDGVRWHLMVRTCNGRVMTQFRFRSGSMYRPVTSWPGRKPKGLGQFFRYYMPHARVAAEQR